MDLQMLNEIFVLMVRLTIIVVFLKLRNQVKQVFILILQGFYLLFYFCHPCDLPVQYPLINFKNTVFGWILPPVNFLLSNSIE